MEVTLKIDELKPSASNVRAKHTKEDITMMAHSIEHRGIINPIAVAKNGDGKYEVIAGRLRYEGAKAAGVSEVRCIDMTAFTESERVEISLAENIDRRGMTAIQYHAAFNKLFKAGMPVPQIAARFDKSEKEVQQLLAIGSLPKKILDLAEAGDIGDRTLRCLAIANGKDVARYAKLSAKDRPRDWETQEWLAGNDGMYLQEHAIFDVDQYTGPKITDLFSENDEVWLRDGGQFWELQHKALAEQLEKFKKTGWQCEQVDHFQEWSYDKVKKADGGKIIYTVDERTGRIQFHKGYDRKKSAGKAPNAKSKDGKTEAKPATSKAFDQYMAETRHYAVAAEMADDERSGLVATIVLLLKQCDNISIANKGSLIKNEDQYESIINGDNFKNVEDEFNATLECMGLKPDCMRWDIDIEAVIEKLDGYDTKSLIQMVNSIMARNWTLTSNGKDSDTLGRALGLTQVREWVADDAFWNGIKNKATLIAIAKENDIPIDEKATTKVIRAIVKEKTPDTWRPEWLIF